MAEQISFLAADWPAPSHIRAGTTLRHGGASALPYDSLNLGDHVGDSAQAMAANRAAVKTMLALPSDPAWLAQVHGTNVVDAGIQFAVDADASVTTAAQAVCAVLTADCLPVLFCNRAGTCWGAAHAGWRGLVAGILEATIARLPARPDRLLAWLGPAIGPDAFEVGQDVHDAFCRHHPEDAAAFAACDRPGKYLADIYRLARARIEQAGVTAIYGGGLCTVSAPDRFYSYRRDGATGRMASLVWRSGDRA